jgi:hypothetical protein
LSLLTTASPCFLLRYAESSKKSQQSQHYPWPRQRTLPKTRVTQETTGIYELRVLISGIRNLRFDSDTTYEYKVFSDFTLCYNLVGHNIHGLNLIKVKLLCICQQKIVKLLIV